MTGALKLRQVATGNPIMSFAELGLSEPIVRAVSEHGYTIPTPIQIQAIPTVLKGGDLLAKTHGLYR